MRNVSVIIPAYNRETTIVKAINSVLKQSYPVGEIIVVDDCSTDQTEGAIRTIGDQRIKYIRTQQNIGPGAARNLGVSNAKYDLIAFQDSDDEWLETKIEKQVDYIEKHPECGLVYTAYEMILLYEIRHVVPDENCTNQLEGRILKDLLKRNTIGAPTVLMSKRVFDEMHGFDESMRSLEDWDLAIRVACNYEIGYIPEVLLRVNRSEKGVSSNLAEFYNNRCYMLKKYKKECNKLGIFDEVALDILNSAAVDHVLEQVRNMMVLYLAH